MTDTTYSAGLTATGFVIDQDFCTQLTDFISRGERYAIFSHQFPDGDAIGSMLSMKQILSDMGKVVDCYTSTTISSTFDRVPQIDQIQTAIDYTKRYSGLIFVDFTEYTRIEGLTSGHEDWFDSHHKIIIDHHEVQATAPLTTAYIVPEISSTCELLYEIWSHINTEAITSIVATYLYLGLTTDTANYLHDGSSTQSLQRGLNLVKLGANKKLVQDMMLRSYTLGSLQFLSLFLSRLQQSHGMYYSYYVDDDLTACGIDREQGEIGTIMLQSIANSDIVVIFKIKSDIIHFSMRSKVTPVDHVARHFGGGGHKHATGGARVPVQPDVTIDVQLMSIVQEIAHMI